MTNTEKITPLQNSEEHQKIVADLETEISTKQAKVEEWKNAYLKSEQERLGLKKALERTAEEKEDWKREASAARKVQLETKEVKEKQDFKTEFIKLQQKKGWQWDESQGWMKA
jgi:hypothetical protein